MNESAEDTPRSLKIGVGLTFTAGLFPFLVSCYQYVMFFVSLAHPSEPWRASGFSPSGFSLDDIIACSKEIADQFVLAQHIEFANVINTGLMILVISICGLLKRAKWAWWTILVIYLWVGTNDALALIRDQQRPVPFIAEVIGIAGLALAWPFVFKTKTT